MNMRPFSHLGDQQLLAQTQRLAGNRRCLEVHILDHLGEIDRRGLALRRGFSSLFDYAVRELRFSDAAAQRRIQALRLCRRHGWVRDKLQNGDLTLTAAAQLETAIAGAERHGKHLRRSPRRGGAQPAGNGRPPGGRGSSEAGCAAGAAPGRQLETGGAGAGRATREAGGRPPARPAAAGGGGQGVPRAAGCCAGGGDRQRRTAGGRSGPRGRYCLLRQRRPARRLRPSAWPATGLPREAISQPVRSRRSGRPARRQQESTAAVWRYGAGSPACSITGAAPAATGAAAAGMAGAAASGGDQRGGGRAGGGGGRGSSMRATGCAGSRGRGCAPCRGG